MANENLEELIEERKKGAMDKDIFGKAQWIAQSLGKEWRGDSIQGGFHYTSRRFLIETHTWNRWQGTYLPMCRVIHKGKIVFSGYSQGHDPYGNRRINVDCYAPGPWLKPFENLYKKAVSKTNKFLATPTDKLNIKLGSREELEENDLRRRFGM